MQKLVKKAYTNLPLAMKVYIMKLTTTEEKWFSLQYLNVLNVRSTTFPHKDIHKETWYWAGSRTANQIDHVLISNRLRSAITDIRALRGPDIGSDHNLLKINFKVKLKVKTGNKYEKEKWWIFFKSQSGNTNML